MEERVSRLQPVAVELDALRTQHDELRPIAKEHRDFANAIDKVRFSVTSKIRLFRYS